MRIRARAVFDPENFKSLGIPSGRGFLLLEITDEYRAKMGEEVKKIVKRQADKYADALAKWNAVPPEHRGPEPVYRDTLLDLELDLNIHYAKRSIDQNALIRGLYDIEANYMNGTPMYENGYYHAKFPDHVITPQELHDDDVEQFSPKIMVRWLKTQVWAFGRGMEFAELGRIWGEPKEVLGDPDKVDVVIAKTTAFMNTLEATVWAKRIIDRLMTNGLLKSDESRFIGLKKDLEDIIKGKKKEKTK